MSNPIELDHPLISGQEIERRVAEMASQINAEYETSQRPLSVVVVLKGACFFGVDLLKHITLPTRVDFLRASSYSGTGSTGEVRLISDITMPIAGHDVLLIEDIVDTGLTARWLLGHLHSHHPASIRLCTLLDKPARRLVQVEASYIGFSIADEFVLGYGLDYNEHYRNLPDIFVARALDPTERGADNS